MTEHCHTSSVVRAAEALVLEKFRTEPFHNLHLLHGVQLTSPSQGGTCSDKTLSFVSAAREAGFDAALHSGYIGGREIHRLARLRIDSRIFFADVGNGWPALRLYPADREVRFRCFGMGFRTEITDTRVVVLHERCGDESMQCEIDIAGKPESEIRTDIARRFDAGTVYPFSSSLRFSQVIDDRFLFLRGERLEIYSEDHFEAVEGISMDEAPEVIRQYFGYRVDQLLPRPGELG